MPITLDEALKFTLKWEGGYTNDPLDPGGPTNFGIIQRRYDEYRNDQNLSKQSVKFITKKEVNDIYEDYYWKPIRAQWVSSPLGLTLFDTAVNLGVGGATARLQASLKVPITSKWTQDISNKIHQSDQVEVALNICKLRIAKRYERIRQRADQKRFLKGWLNRDNDLIKEVKKLSNLNILSIDENEFGYEFDSDEILNLFDPLLLLDIAKFDDDDEN
jgi:lysozyme family protein